MQTVPSLIGAGTAAAAAATGLVFGQLADEQQFPPSRANSSKRRSAFAGAFSNAFPSRPGTRSSSLPVANVIHPPPHDESNSYHHNKQQQQQQQLQQTHHQQQQQQQQQQPQQQSQHQQQQTPPLNTAAASTQSQSQSRPRSSRRPSSQVHVPAPALAPAPASKPVVGRSTTAKQGDALSPDETRDSLSSNGSWIRRLSIRPLSQHESIRSSIGPDSPSVFSHGSGAPILGFTDYTPPQLPPNKLVKRASTRNGTSANTSSPKSTRPQVTLRRPATSHQRSATLQQQMEAQPELIQTPSEHSSDQHNNRPRAQTLEAPSRSASRLSRKTSSWKSFWHARLTRTISRNIPRRLGDSIAPTSGKRICVDHRGLDNRAYLMTPDSIIPEAASKDEAGPEMPGTGEGSEFHPISATLEKTPSKEPRRSRSLHFSSPTTWLPKTGSIRRRKRGDGEHAEGTQRNVSAPIAPDTETDQAHGRPATAIASGGADSSRAESDLSAIFRPPNTRRKSSSPLLPPRTSALPPLNRLSGIDIDLTQLGSPTTLGRPDELLVSSKSTRRVSSGTSQARTLDRSSTVASSEYRGFTSGDDDTDCKTDTLYDSFRTTASARQRNLDSPVESMFDESPPSTAGINTKPKRLSIQEILGPLYDGKITEEDENLPTPVRGTNGGLDPRFLMPTSEPRHEQSNGSISPEIPLDRDTRLSLDDDDDLDWAREDESQLYNHLSPPGSMNSRRGSPSLRMALANISGNGTFDPHHDTASERPRSTIFDWAEPTYHDRYDGNGYAFRPKTVHGKQEMDLRSGRVNRNRPMAAHVRSQSVPAVPDLIDGSSKTMPKFGTWGMGTKNASEDWDDDFEFEEESEFGLANGKKHERQFSMLVPASIQATQPTVKAHSGQIRELSLLVNDLKRLCRLGREMEMLKGPSASLWQKAENIITLASPDEDPVEESAPAPRSPGSRRDTTDQRFLDQGFDGAVLDLENEFSVTSSPNGSGGRAQYTNRRRSVFSPEDDIFGTWDQAEQPPIPDRPGSPEKSDDDADVGRSVMTAMWSRYPKASSNSGHGAGNTKFNFDTNSLKDLVKQASDLRDVLSDFVRRADRITQSPARTPRRDRSDGSPAFTRVFDEPTSSPSRRFSQGHGSSVLNGTPVTTSPSNRISQRMQMMTVN